MPICNIIDRRSRPYRFLKVNAIIEPTRHDNRCKNADRAKPNRKMDKDWVGYDNLKNVMVANAIQWADAHTDTVTLYLYDKDGGIYVARKARRRRGKIS